MQKFKISGMSCAACSARVEKAVSKLDGVERCSVNLLTNSMEVIGAATDEEIISAVKKRDTERKPITTALQDRKTIRQRTINRQRTKRSRK